VTRAVATYIVTRRLPEDNDVLARHFLDDTVQRGARNSEHDSAARFEHQRWPSGATSSPAAALKYRRAAK
jgi:hypothetical protein